MKSVRAADAASSPGQCVRRTRRFERPRSPRVVHELDPDAVGILDERRIIRRREPGILLRVAHNRPAGIRRKGMYAVDLGARGDGEREVVPADPPVFVGSGGRVWLRDRTYVGDAPACCSGMRIRRTSFPASARSYALLPPRAARSISTEQHASTEFLRRNSTDSRHRQIGLTDRVTPSPRRRRDGTSPMLRPIRRWRRVLPSTSMRGPGPSMATTAGPSASFPKT